MWLICIATLAYAGKEQHTIQLTLKTSEAALLYYLYQYSSYPKLIFILMEATTEALPSGRICDPRFSEALSPSRYSRLGQITSLMFHENCGEQSFFITGSRLPLSC